MLSLELEGSFTQVNHPKITGAIEGDQGPGAEVVGCGGDFQGSGSGIFSLKHIRDSGRPSIERAPGGSLVQIGEPLYIEQIPAGTGQDSKSRFKGWLSPRANPEHPP